LAALRARLAATVRDGAVASVGERQADAGAVAAPLFGPDGEVRGSISVCGPRHRFTRAAVGRYRPLVRDAAREIAHNWATPRRT
ncbi:IclR family transcriptional regulator domain-containing protein, partial [Actinomadura roseirufa]|uniref:IclR family transcriptional regulator domain-containing protein n=1 Tax=Actinomadura roseirufa TaxID=2094049 RepID=UPI00241541C0